MVKNLPFWFWWRFFARQRLESSNVVGKCFNGCKNFETSGISNLWTRRKGKKAWEYGGFRIASSPKSCSIKTWTNYVKVAGDGAGIRISSKHQQVNVLKFFCL
jgi:hypothetical protein